MEKRAFLAILLSLMILIGWSLLVSKFYHIDNKEVVEPTSLQPQRLTPPDIKTGAAGQKIQLALGPEETEPTGVINIEGAQIRYGKNSGQIKEVLFKDFNHTFYLNQGFAFPGVTFTEVKADNGLLVISGDDGQKRITLEFTLHNINSINRLVIKIQNLTSQTITFPFKLILIGSNLAKRDLYSRFNQAIVGLSERIIRPSLRRRFESREFIDFIAFRDRYFCVILAPQFGNFEAYIEKINNKYSFFGLRASNVVVLPQSTDTFKFDFYLGPQQIEQIAHLNKRWAEIVNFGFFDTVSKFLFGIIRAFHSITKNWGLAIVLFSIAIFILLFPLTLKQIRSMKEMQAIQPQMEKLRKMYKDNPQKLNKEMIELYKTHKVNPLGGCLPLMLQIPIFISLYQALMRAVELKGANFLWIKDLSEPDKAFVLNQSLPIIGREINILPILMLIVMFWQQRTSLKTSSGANVEQQKMMSIIFPLLFGVIFYHMPSGLVLYWLLNSTLMAFFQFKMVRNV